MFHVIPSDYIGKVKSDALILLGIIISLNNAKLGCIAKNYYFAEKMNKTERSIQNYLNELKEMDLIEIEMVQRNTKHLPIRVITPTLKDLPGIKDKVEAVKRKDKQENRSDIEPDWFDEYKKDF